MTKLEIVKAVSEGVVSIGVLNIVKNVVTATTPPAARPIVRGCIAVGSWIVADMVSNAAITHTEKKIDEMFTQIKDVLTLVQQ